VGGLRLPHDETGDCFKFTNALAEMARAQGVEFMPSTTIARIVEEGGRITRVETDRGPVVADAYLVALGSFSPFWSSRWG
jgi:D-amino-acid dehydrogenase